MRALLQALPPRLRHLLFGWGSVGVAYSLGGLLQRPATLLTESALDRLLPFDPAGVWCYLSFFLLVPLGYLACPAARLPWLTRAMQCCALASGLAFIAWPTTLAYPALPAAGGWSTTLLQWLAAADTAQNCLPSLHGALTVLAAWALLQWRERPLRSLLVVLWAAAIAYSIVQARRHLSIDLGAGVVLGLAAGRLCRPAATHASLCPLPETTAP
ncbi:phosphatase PAP2 family protein [Eleftheria terrae]|uniref:phosphatase PAP2 family protein n=1 Tax=Eleftheria terrae TaxID=1597781 RepID=UPI00263A7514|nr:phosphatase PAP2 family protein [Eleftheria terrae]WKB53562.1 phosphatase PAP2 family protein [Eleftheria terrae]